MTKVNQTLFLEFESCMERQEFKIVGAYYMIQQFHLHLVSDPWSVSHPFTQ